MKEYILQLDVQTLKVYRDNYRQLFKKKFDWTRRFYFEIFVGSYRYVSKEFQLDTPSEPPTYDRRRRSPGVQPQLDSQGESLPREVHRALVESAWE